MPKLSVSNQTRMSNFIKMLIAPFMPQADMDSSNWNHLKEISPKPQRNNGFITQFPDPSMQWLFDKMIIEQDRLSTLTDIRIMLDEAAYIDGVCNKFILWATVGKPNLIFTGGTSKKAEQIVNNMLDRIQYFDRRADYLYNGLFLEAFLKKAIIFEQGVEDALTLGSGDLVREFMRGQALGRIEDILGPLPAETCFRNSNHQDTFPNPKQSFYQVPEYQNSPQLPLEMKTGKQWFHNMEILHPRWNHRRQKSHRYSRPALKPTRMAYHRVEMSAQDAVVQRHLAASRLLVIYLKANVALGNDIGVSNESIDQFMGDFIQKYPTGFNKPGTVYATSGANKVESIGDLNITLSKPADIYMHFDFMSVSLMLHPILAGFTGGEGGRITGPLLEQLRDNLVMDIEAVNAWEDRQILLPLCYFELFLNGIFDVEINVTHGLPAFLKNVERKVRMSEVELGACSRETYYDEFLSVKTGRTWVEEKPKITAEIEEIGGATATENVNKGMNGSKKEAANTPVQPTKQSAVLEVDTISKIDIIEALSPIHEEINRIERDLHNRISQQKPVAITFPEIKFPAMPPVTVNNPEQPITLNLEIKQDSKTNKKTIQIKDADGNVIRSGEMVEG